MRLLGAKAGHGIEKQKNTCSLPDGRRMGGAVELYTSWGWSHIANACSTWEAALCRFLCGVDKGKSNITNPDRRPLVDLGTCRSREGPYIMKKISPGKVLLSYGWWCTTVVEVLSKQSQHGTETRVPVSGGCGYPEPTGSPTLSLSR